VAQTPARRADALPADYPELLAEVKARVLAAHTGGPRGQPVAHRAVLGDRPGHPPAGAARGLGSKVIDRLAGDLRREFPDMTGFSRSNLKCMRAFADSWPQEESGQPVGQQPVGQLPWGQNIALLTKLDDRDARLWYAREAIEHGWSRKVLEAQIASDLRGRQGNALTSFEQALPAPDSELVRDALKDPYNFEFLNLSAEAKERDLELALLNDVQSFLMEMGHGFALVGRQFPLRVCDEETGEEQEFFLDLLFYNYILRRFVVIDLKIEDFKPEFAGKMNFYLNVVDELQRQPADAPSIGLILCPGRSKTVTEWALPGVDTPVAVARYVTGGMALAQSAPAELRPALPDLPDLSNRFSVGHDVSCRQPSDNKLYPSP
jgi:predicted nuclease of restriction endonuclease-like (RecB) superfamily